MPPPPPLARRLYLASASPRRARLLHEAGYTFEQVAPPFDDTAEDVGGLRPEQAAAALAERKAAAVAELLRGKGPGIVLGCDTLLSVDGHAVGKPRDEADARRILSMLIGRAHEAVSAVCLFDTANGRRRTILDAAGIRLGALDAATVDRYIRSGAWRGKAGGYNLAELERRWPIEVAGDPTTVIGLPMRKLADALGRFG